MKSFTAIAALVLCCSAVLVCGEPPRFGSRYRSQPQQVYGPPSTTEVPSTTQHTDFEEVGDFGAVPERLVKANLEKNPRPVYYVLPDDHHHHHHDFNYDRFHHHDLYHKSLPFSSRLQAFNPSHFHYTPHYNHFF